MMEMSLEILYHTKKLHWFPYHPAFGPAKDEYVSGFVDMEMMATKERFDEWFKIAYNRAFYLSPFQFDSKIDNDNWDGLIDNIENILERKVSMEGW